MINFFKGIIVGIGGISPGLSGSVLLVILGLILFQANKNIFPVITKPNLLQSILLGITVAGSSIVPGVDSAVILSSLGLYEFHIF